MQTIDQTLRKKINGIRKENLEINSPHQKLRYNPLNKKPRGRRGKREKEKEDEREEEEEEQKQVLRVKEAVNRKKKKRKRNLSRVLRALKYCHGNKRLKTK